MIIGMGSSGWMMRGGARGAGIGCIVGELGWGGCCLGHGSDNHGSNIRKNRVVA